MSVYGLVAMNGVRSRQIRSCRV